MDKISFMILSMISIVCCTNLKLIHKLLNFILPIKTIDVCGESSKMDNYIPSKMALLSNLEKSNLDSNKLYSKKNK